MKKRIVKEKYRHPTPSDALPVRRAVRIFNETSVRVPRTALTTIYTDLLKEHCSLNVVCIDNAYARTLNKTYRNKDTPANILTFPPNDAGVAEIYINTALVAKTAKKHHISVKKQFLFLYIHGILHLLGHRHGAQMEMLEDRYTTMYT